MSTGRDVRFKNIHLKSNAAIYIGDMDNAGATARDDRYENGTWKITRSGNDLVVYRKESGTFTEKGRFEAS